MMKKIFLVLIALLGMTLPCAASNYSSRYLKCGCGDWYAGAFGGYNWVAKNGWKVPPNPVPQSTTTPTSENTTFLPHFNLRRYKPGYVLGGSIGYRWVNGFRLELEGSYRYNQLKRKRHDASNHQTSAVLANAIYQFHFEFICIDMFFGGGLGYSNTYHRHHEKAVGDRNGFAWQAIGGLAYPVTDKFDITIEYRYFNEVRAKFRNNSADLGFRYYL